jgi:hypothetical protein
VLRRCMFYFIVAFHNNKFNYQVYRALLYFSETGEWDPPSGTESAFSEVNWGKGSPEMGPWVSAVIKQILKFSESKWYDILERADELRRARGKGRKKKIKGVVEVTEQEEDEYEMVGSD